MACSQCLCMKLMLHGTLLYTNAFHGEAEDWGKNLQANGTRSKPEIICVDTIRRHRKFQKLYLSGRMLFNTYTGARDTS